MRLMDSRRGVCSLCGGDQAVRVIDWEKEGIANLPVCFRCRAGLLAKLADAVAEEAGNPETLPVSPPILSEAAERIAAEAATMTEEAFETKYLQDTLDRIIFEYIHGYGETNMDGEGCAMVVLMMDGTASEQDVQEHLLSLTERGIIYPVTGKSGWFGAEFSFKDD